MSQPYSAQAQLEAQRTLEEPLHANPSGNPRASADRVDPRDAFPWISRLIRRIHPLALAAAVLGLCGRHVWAGAGGNAPPPPPASARILKIIHGWPDDGTAQDALIARLKAQGFGGVVCNLSFDSYLESEPKWQAFERAVKHAKEAGMALWLYDEKGYPSGNAGGLVLRDHPEDQARGLLVAQANSKDGNIDLTVPPGTLVLAAAFPIDQGQVDLTRRIDLAGEIRNGSIAWKAPGGSWQAIVFTESPLHEGTHADGNLWQKMPYVNLLKAEPTARFIQLTHDRYAARLGSDLGRYFEATFTDEPSLMSCFLKQMPYRPLPWSQDFARQFRQRRGYEPDWQVLVSLAANTGTPADTAKHRYDFWLTVAELTSENYFGQIQTWGRKHGIPSGGHLLLEENLAAHVPLYGDFMRCARRLDAPSLDCLTSIPAEVPWYVARLLGSVADLENHPLVMCETSDHGQVYRGPGDNRPKQTVTEAEIRGTCNKLIVAGVNCITSYYSFTGLDDAALNRLNEWVGRCCAALRGGSQVADVALLYPIESAWCQFTPSRHWANESQGALTVERAFRAAEEQLFSSRRDFTIVDSRALAEAKVEGNTLVHGALRWKVVVLPRTDTLPSRAWENLQRFVEHGGAVVALGTTPSNSEREFPSKRAQSLGQRLFTTGKGPVAKEHRGGTGGSSVFLPPGLEALLPLVLDGLVERDASTDDIEAPLRTAHRQVGNREVYFLINDSPRPWSGNVSFHASGHGRRLDPSGTRPPQDIQDSSLRLDLEGFGATIVEFDRTTEHRRLKSQGGSLPNLVLEPLARVEPTTPHGEFVQGTITPTAITITTPTMQGPAWKVSGLLTKSNVDTFQFVDFSYPTPVDLSGADCIAFDTIIPPGQSGTPQLLAILAEDGGEDFIATTGHSLAVEGTATHYLSIKQFERAGWSKPGDGRLDLRRVRAVRIGWGGYLGTQGEALSFTLGLPKVGRLKPSPTASNK